MLSLAGISHFSYAGGNLEGSSVARTLLLVTAAVLVRATIRSSSMCRAVLTARSRDVGQRMP